MQPGFEGFRRKVEESFAKQDFMASIGAEIAAIDAGRVCLTAPVRPGFRQQHGYAHAGLTFALGDSAAGYAALTLMPRDREVVTSEMKIHLLAPARGGRLRAVGQVIRAGRRLIVVRADVEEEGPDPEAPAIPVATLLGTMVSTPIA